MTDQEKQKIVDNIAKNGYIFDRATYKMVRSMTRENFERFCVNMYIRGWEDAKQQTIGVDELLGSFADIKGIGEKRSEALKEQAYKQFENM